MHFRDIYGADTVPYIDWIWRDGVVQARIPPELLPERQAPETSTRGEPLALDEGVNIAGYFRSELGIGEAARLLTSAVEAARIPYSTITTDTGALSRQSRDFGNRPEGVAAYDINLVCVNADMMPRFATTWGRSSRSSHDRLLVLGGRTVSAALPRRSTRSTGGRDGLRGRRDPEGRPKAGVHGAGAGADPAAFTGDHPGAPRPAR
jgi:hypothetical protein